MALLGVPITLVTGFLGAGKTTLINQILQDTTVPSDQIAIIVNEFGQVGIDHQLLLQTEEKVYQLNNGCICCSLRTDLATTLQALVDYFEKEERPLAHVIIETTGISDPAPIIQTLTLTPNLSQRFFIDAILVLIDCLNFSQILAHNQEVYQQISYADRFILTKSDQVSPFTKATILKELKQLNPLADMRYFYLDKPYAVEEFFHLAKFHGLAQPLESEYQKLDKDTAKQNSCQDPQCQEEGHHHHHHHEFVSIVLTTNHYLREDLLVKWLDWLLFNFNGKLYRYKGLVRVADRDLLVALQGVNVAYRFDMSQYLADELGTQLVLIGKGLDEQTIRHSFNDVIQLSQEPR
ncbi:CobW family GTP-binding protein [Vaginisenegalia massiliensis]|uniref:CobW family GTP-binding protein n=1 Tax=Vaginisenegalia massiliensis TaxID=2058294 RepID=UPI000F5410AD|nr:GTP-binding protein [Vaginisenegalia massiliensis]